MYVKDLSSVGDSTKIINLFDVKGKVVVVTGGARGIGLMIAQGFVANGAKVIISSRSAQTCQEAAEALNSMGPGTCYSIPADLAKEPECKRLASEIAKRESRVDILVNNAGANWGESVDTFPDSAWDKVIALNVKSIFFLSRYLLPLLEAGASDGNPSRIINIGSIDGIRVPFLETYSYSASKAAVHHLTRVLSQRFAIKNITVNCIAAGGFETKMMAETLKNNREAIESAIPLRRLGNPADISGICIYLASPAASWVTGAIIPVEGGVLSKASL